VIAAKPDNDGKAKAKPQVVNELMKKNLGI
jgi:hypothetical protein